MITSGTYGPHGYLFVYVFARRRTNWRVVSGSGSAMLERRADRLGIAGAGRDGVDDEVDGHGVEVRLLGAEAATDRPNWAIRWMNQG